MTTAVREARESDMPFIVSSWRQSYEGSPAVRGADRDHYFAELARAIRKLTSAGEVRVACDAQDDDTLLGFVAFKGTELHYAYVRKDFRGNGLMRDMLQGVAIDSYTFTTPRWKPKAGLRFTPRFTL